MLTPLDIVKRVSNGPKGVNKRYSVPNNMNNVPQQKSVQKNKQMLSMLIKGSTEAKKAQGTEQKIVINRPATN